MRVISLPGVYMERRKGFPEQLLRQHVQELHCFTFTQLWAMKQILCRSKLFQCQGYWFSSTSTQQPMYGVICCFRKVETMCQLCPSISQSTDQVPVGKYRGECLSLTNGAQGGKVANTNMHNSFGDVRFEHCLFCTPKTRLEVKLEQMWSFLWLGAKG